MTLFDIRVTTTVNRRVVGSSPTGGARKKALAFASAFFNEINPFGICEMPCGREIRLRRMKSLRR